MYYNKYLKYKTKYLSLKTSQINANNLPIVNMQHGGGHKDDIDDCTLYYKIIMKDDTHFYMYKVPDGDNKYDFITLTQPKAVTKNYDGRDNFHGFVIAHKPKSIHDIFREYIISQFNGGEKIQFTFSRIVDGVQHYQYTDLKCNYLIILDGSNINNLKNRDNPNGTISNIADNDIKNMLMLLVQIKNHL